eukprot:CAMPEP_0175087240 /NCGR_PEP_ID=MMETSP0052_2-20121109/29721_1 /TAXON_ID=51329 ORGANISM="Polytomella parva, Strain SAG 63-3" /NCGR_SAMPLE_ID=MMETSP0052_2 /ASSEMBLY_ACC=CAM_ASM_000194 /LENGTH=865 /DNA_ID=CAMNT_0016359565 /DNA_START=204 /DNA_END=2798 /DNA_ORIENTATION=+
MPSSIRPGLLPEGSSSKYSNRIIHDSPLVAESSTASHMTSRSIDRIAASKIKGDGGDSSNDSMSEDDLSQIHGSKIKSIHRGPSSVKSSSSQIRAEASSASERRRKAAPVDVSDSMDPSLNSSREKRKLEPVDTFLKNLELRPKVTKQGSYKTLSQTGIILSESHRKAGSAIAAAASTAPSSSSLKYDFSDRLSKSKQPSAKNVNLDREQVIAGIHHAAQANFLQDLPKKSGLENPRDPIALSFKSAPECVPGSGPGSVASSSHRNSHRRRPSNAGVPGADDSVTPEASRETVFPENSNRPDRVKEWLQEVPSHLAPPSSNPSLLNVNSESTLPSFLVTGKSTAAATMAAAIISNRRRREGPRERRSLELGLDDDDKSASVLPAATATLVTITPTVPLPPTVVPLPSTVVPLSPPPATAAAAAATHRYGPESGARTPEGSHEGSCEEAAYMYTETSSPFRSTTHLESLYPSMSHVVEEGANGPVDNAPVSENDLVSMMLQLISSLSPSTAAMLSEAAAAAAAAAAGGVGGGGGEGGEGEREGREREGEEEGEEEGVEEDQEGKEEDQGRQEQGKEDESEGEKNNQYETDQGPEDPSKSRASEFGSEAMSPRSSALAVQPSGVVDSVVGEVIDNTGADDEEEMEEENREREEENKEREGDNNDIDNNDEQKERSERSEGEAKAIASTAITTAANHPMLSHSDAAVAAASLLSPLPLPPPTLDLVQIPSKTGLSEISSVVPFEQLSSPLPLPSPSPSPSPPPPVLMPLSRTATSAAAVAIDSFDLDQCIHQIQEGTKDASTLIASMKQANAESERLRWSEEARESSQRLLNDMPLPQVCQYIEESLRGFEKGPDQLARIFGLESGSG